MCASDKMNDVKIFTFDITEHRTLNRKRFLHTVHTIISNDHDNEMFANISDCYNCCFPSQPKRCPCCVLPINLVHSYIFFCFVVVLFSCYGEFEISSKGRIEGASKENRQTEQKNIKPTPMSVPMPITRYVTFT